MLGGVGGRAVESGGWGVCERGRLSRLVKVVTMELEEEVVS